MIVFVVGNAEALVCSAVGPQTGARLQLVPTMRQRLYLR